MTTTAQVPVTPTPTLAQEMRGTMLLFGMFGLAFVLLGMLVGAIALMQALAS
ncbi:MAG: hypothetical protein QOI76_3458 [Frankiales bacterium]|jgi:hypothetical protein|nr:hypothetical protein [Frankiales bacterium]MDX6254502.1 hypothetical protein [Frankiales bacterium]